MNEKEIREKFEQALKVKDDGTGQLFMYSLLDFDIQYDEKVERVYISVPVTEIMFNPIGFLHGGILTYIADTAMGHLCAAFAESPSVSLELKTQFFRTTRKGTIHATAYFTKKGKNVQFVECVLKDNEDRDLGKVTGTFYSLNN
ncbi:PaaI family thioesterase [Evansella tamaricis]|uniref:PaaI family thioesterase n=1 Tax=Evansella tamaricis TaxID=2069301 RepID=A0ABS6JG87_9BACI|nr:PaaI family thioesterase [Evansella tamaricis]MBU9712662.1 PaaI family thioesterase [Evansella tamaricis]